MKLLIPFVCALLAVSVSAEELKKLTKEDYDLLRRDYRTLTSAEKVKREDVVKLLYMIEEGGPMDMPGTPSGKIRVANLQGRVPQKDLERVKKAFIGMMSYDIQFTDKDEGGDIVVRIVDKEGGKSLTVWPDEGKAEVNVAALASDNPKPAFLAARTRKEILRAFSCATCGSTSEAPLFGHLSSVSSLDDIAMEDFTIDVVMRTTSYLKGAGIRPLVKGSYLDAIEEGYDIPPTNGYQRVLYEKVKKTTKLNKKLP